MSVLVPVCKRLQLKLIDVTYILPTKTKSTHSALVRGEWRRCAQLVTTLPCWQLLAAPNAMRALLSRLVQREALRTYLLSYRCVSFDTE